MDMAIRATVAAIRPASHVGKFSKITSRATAHNFHLGITFLLELSAAAGSLPLSFHHGELSPGDGMLAEPQWFVFESFFANFRERVAAGGGTCYECPPKSNLQPCMK
jgi:hypothetical protein